MPDAFCSDWLTFKGKGKEEGVQVHSDDIIDRYDKNIYVIYPVP